MIRAIKRGAEIIREEGINSLVKTIPPYAYQKIWPVLPEDGYIIKNRNLSSRKKKLTDEYMPEMVLAYVPSDDALHEERYINAIREYIIADESVVMIGGGTGISAVAAAKQVGDLGEVNVFEAGATEIENTKLTANINGVSGIITTHHAIVSDEFSIRSSSDTAELISPSELPDCNTIAIDADGAEIPILEDITKLPRTLIVEHHAVLNEDEIIVEYQPDKVRSLIHDLGYEIIDEKADQDIAYGRFEERIFIAELSGQKA